MTFKSQLEVLRAVRKPTVAPPTKVVPAKKGGSFKRPQGNWRKWLDQ